MRDSIPFKRVKYSMDITNSTTEISQKSPLIWMTWECCGILHNHFCGPSTSQRFHFHFKRWTYGWMIWVIIQTLRNTSFRGVNARDSTKILYRNVRNCFLWSSNDAMISLSIQNSRVLNGHHTSNLRPGGTPLYGGGTPQSFLKMSFNKHVWHFPWL